MVINPCRKVVVKESANTFFRGRFQLVEHYVVGRHPVVEKHCCLNDFFVLNEIQVIGYIGVVSHIACRSGKLYVFCVTDTSIKH